MLDTVQSRCFFLAPERPQLYPRIDRRFDAMMATGARGSVGAPCARARSGLAGDARPRVPRLIAYLERRLSLKEAIARASWTRGIMSSGGSPLRDISCAASTGLPHANPLAEIRASAASRLEPEALSLFF